MLSAGAHELGALAQTVFDIDIEHCPQCGGRLKIIAAIEDSPLIREHPASQEFGTTLLARARVHGLGRSLSYATRYCSTRLGTPIPADVAAEIARLGPGAISCAAMDRLVQRALLTNPPEEGPASGIRFARWVVFVRSMWLRMPPWLLAYHTLAKFVRGLWQKPRATEDG